MKFKHTRHLLDGPPRESASPMPAAMKKVRARTGERALIADR